MRHFSRSHGRHCYLRSFKSECPRCGADILYWECTHGSKVFFEYPPYGKLIKHICKRRRQKNIKKRHKNIVKTPKGLLENPNVFCPACGKAFNNKESLRDHVKELEKCDYYHKIFFSTLQFNDQEDIDLNPPEMNHKNNNKNKYDKPVFGKINFKNKNDYY
ncbi:MAG: hypothetical protein BAJALOKI1v1_280020 [Promethearchaeota archaeon]|nr:MAG: hypothetical protein BAJALOKI1v1_280020 [Candidatus Lokiarchaeota archaeon]